MNPVDTWRYGNEALQEPLHYTQCGLDDVYLGSGYEVKNTRNGRSVTIKNQDGLHAAIAHHLVVEKKTLSGREIRFVRKRMDLTQSDLARLLGMDTQSVARWEKDECKASGPADRMLRVLYLEFEKTPQNIMALLKHLDETDAPLDDRQFFDQTNEGWRSRSAA